ncbi:hypothetical protein FRC05_001846 [Tulasnella sp. 425]|nr:hypothetical protein FRC05_001846 [Tulasnella sp. 425]
MANVSSQNGIKANGAPVPREIEIEMLGGVNRVVSRDTASTNGARRVGRINLVLTPDESQEFANKFYKVCEDSSISRTATFGLLERQITVELTGNGPPTNLTMGPTRARAGGLMGFFGRGDPVKVPASTGNAAAEGTVDPSSSFFPKAGSGQRKLRHDEPFVLSGRPGSSEILISTEAATSLDGRWVVFGRVADQASENIVKRIKRYAATNQNKVFIASAGVGDAPGSPPKTVSVAPELSTPAGSTLSSGQVAAT